MRRKRPSRPANNFFTKGLRGVNPKIKIALYAISICLILTYIGLGIHIRLTKPKPYWPYTANATQVMQWINQNRNLYLYEVKPVEEIEFPMIKGAELLNPPPEDDTQAQAYVDELAQILPHGEKDFLVFYSPIPDQRYVLGIMSRLQNRIPHIYALAGDPSQWEKAGFTLTYTLMFPEPE